MLTELARDAHIAENEKESSAAKEGEGLSGGLISAHLYEDEDGTAPCHPMQS
jgi:hypothetical protein